MGFNLAFKGLNISFNGLGQLHVHESVHRDTSMKNNQQDAPYRLIYYSKLPLHVSGDVFAHHQEHLPVFTVSGSVHPSYCRLVSVIFIVT